MSNMYYLLFHKGKAAALTCWTKHALNRSSEDGWAVEGHDDWPEPRVSYEDLLKEKLKDNIPDNVAYLTVDKFWERYVEEGELK